MPSFKLNFISTPKRYGHTAAVPMFKSASCPTLARREHLSEDKSQFIHDNWLKARSATNFPKPFVIETKPALLPPRSSKADVPKKSDIVVPAMFESLVSAACPNPCACPCGPCCGPCGPCCGNMADCNCGRLLPPPCNTPPKCIQYMQGYYYYPYGTWFCGPYHVSTGGVPCCGPVCPGTACGIAPPNPNLLCGKCCCGLLSCTLCNPPTSGGPGTAGPLGSCGTPFLPGPWNTCSTGPNVTSCFGACGIPCPQGFGMPSPQGFIGMPGPQGFTGMCGPQGFPGMPGSQGFAGFPSQGVCGLPCSQDSWAQPQESMAQGYPPIPFGVPGCTTQSPMPSGNGFNVSFSPVPLFNTSTSQTMPTSVNFPCPVTPQWAVAHAPCECANCVASRSKSAAEQSQSVPQVDTPKVMRSIVEPISKAFPMKKPKNLAEQCKERPKVNKILENPKVKATFP